MHFQKPMLGVPLDWSNPLNKGLVMHLGMQEGHGNVVRDLSMNGNHGAIKNMAFPSTPASGWNPGQTGVGLNFDGTDDYVDCGNNASLNFTDAITIGAWVKPTVLTGDISRGIVDRDGINNWLWYAYNDRMLFRYRDVDGAIQTLDSGAASLVVNEYQHVMLTYTDSTHAASFYRDSVLVGSDSGTKDMKKTGFHDMYIGKWGVNHLNGSIDQPRIHNRALTAKEVQDYYINPWQVYLDDGGN